MVISLGVRELDPPLLWTVQIDQEVVSVTQSRESKFDYWYGNKAIFDDAVEQVITLMASRFTCQLDGVVVEYMFSILVGVVKRFTNNNPVRYHHRLQGIALPYEDELDPEALKHDDWVLKQVKEVLKQEYRIS